MKSGVSQHDSKNGKLHQVLELSLEHKPCYSYEFVEQKLDYIHHNTVSKNWSLVDDWKDYEHSSAGFYETGINTKIELTHCKEIEL